MQILEVSCERCALNLWCLPQVSLRINPIEGREGVMGKNEGD